MRLDFSSVDGSGEFISMNHPDPKKAKMAYVDPPRYEEQKYSTCYFSTTTMERDMFEIRNDRDIDGPLRP